MVLQCSAGNFTKAKSMLDIVERWKFVVVGKSPWWKCRFSKVAGLEPIPAILLKMGSITEIFSHVFCKIALLKISQNFLRNIFTIHSISKKVAGLLPIGCKFGENFVFDKNIESYLLTLNEVYIL